MVLHLAAALLLQHAAARDAETLRILFIGNSFTSYNDLPGMVKKLLESDGRKRKVHVEMRFAPHLNDLYPSESARKLVRDGRWSWVVLEGAMVSMSLSREYPQEGAIGFAKLAKAGGARPLFWSEWPRRGIEETEYTENVYRKIGKATGTPVVPVGRIWDAVLKSQPGLTLWAPDGNHSTPAGTFLAATAIYQAIAGAEGRPSWRLPGLQDDAVREIQMRSRRLAVRR